MKFKCGYSLEIFIIITLILLWPSLLLSLISIILFLIWYVKFLLLKRFSKLVCTKNLRSFCILAAIAADFFALSLLTIAMVNEELLIISGCVETNPGPDNKINFGVWNLDSLLTRDKHKISLIEGINSVNKFDMFGVVESYLTPEISDDQLEIHGFSSIPFRADSTDIGRPRGGVCLYYNENLPVIDRSNLTSINETIVAEIRLKRKKIFFILSYRSPSKNSAAEEDDYCKNMQLLLDAINKENPYAIILTGDFNARSPLFWQDETIENSLGKKLSDLMLFNQMDQIINEPTHFPRDNIGTCIDLIMTNQPNLFVHSGVIQSPDPMCKHQIIHGIINLTFPCPPPYKRKFWSYSKADTKKIKDNLNAINWNEYLSNKSADEMVTCFSKTFLDIMNCNIPNREATINDKDAPWITPEVKQAIKKNHRVYSKWKRDGKPDTGKAVLKTVNEETDRKIETAKSNYYKDLEIKLSNSKNDNIFWSVVNRLVGRNKKMTNIPPLLEHGNFVTSFQEKADLFNKYFANQCIPIENGSVLPDLHVRENKLSDINVDASQISSIISKLHSKKAHGHDDIAINMLKIAKDEVSIPLKLIFDKCISTGKYPSEWKKANVQPVHKKNSRQDKSNYRPISLLPICSKIFEKILFDPIYNHLNSNGLISKHQSGFRPGDSTINQLLAITHSIYKSFEDGCETRALFLDISKAFDKVWYPGLIFKLRQNGIDGNLLELMTDYLRNRHQRVVLNGVHSTWLPLNSGVPQGSVLGPLLFLVYINDLTSNISSSIKLFADDASLFLQVRDIGMCHQTIQKDLKTITAWAHQWRMKFNPDISKQAVEVIFSQKRNKPEHPPISFNGIPVKRDSETQHLGIILDDKLNFRNHIASKIKVATKGLGLLKYLSKFMNCEKLNLMYKTYVRPHLDCGDVIYHDQLSEMMKKLESVQYNAALIVSGCWKGTSMDKINSELGWECLKDRRNFRRLSLYYKIKNNMTPRYLISLAKSFPANITNRFSNSFFPYCDKKWNLLDNSLKESPSLSVFKTNFLKNIRKPARKYYDVKDRKGTKILTKLRVDFSDLREHRFRHNFNCESSICRCGVGDESNMHYLTSCNLFSEQRTRLYDSVRPLIPNFNTLSDDEKTSYLLFGNKLLKNEINKDILFATIKFINATKRFDKLEAFNET